MDANEIKMFIMGAQAMQKLQESKELAEKMEKVNKNLRCLFEDYDKQVKPAKEFICKVMKVQELDILPATIRLMEAAVEKDNAVHAMWFMSAAVDLINEKKK